MPAGIESGGRKDKDCFRAAAIFYEYFIWRKGKGGVTLESIIDAEEITMPEWDFDNPSSMDAWDMGSAAYAEQLSGEVRAAIGAELRPGNIWENVELPRLMKNPDVTKIKIIGPKTGIETIIFER